MSKQKTSSKERALDHSISERAKAVPLYASALDLRNSVQAAIVIAELEEEGINPATHAAALAFIENLDRALDNWDAATKQNTSVEQTKTLFSKKTKVSNSPILQTDIDLELIQACQSVVSTYKNLLTKDPHFWEQFKAAVNDLLKACGYQEALSVKKSSLTSQADTVIGEEDPLEKNIEDIQRYKHKSG